MVPNNGTHIFSNFFSVLCKLSHTLASAGSANFYTITKS